METEQLTELIEKEALLSLPLLEQEMSMIGFKYLGNHNDFKLYGCEHDRLVYEKKIHRSGIYYGFKKHYKSPKYIAPSKSELDKIIKDNEQYMI